MVVELLDKNALKAQIRQQIQEKALTEKKEDPKYSVGGFFSNIGSDAGEIVRGIGSLMGLGGKAIMHPVETIEFVKSPEFKESLKQVGSSLVSEYKEYKQPLKKLYEDPLQVFTDAITIATLGGGAVTKVGQVAKSASLIRAGKAISYAGKPIAVTKDVTKLGVSKIPGGKELITALQQRSKAIETVSSSQLKNITERSKYAQEIETTMKKLTPAEKATVIPYAQKTVTLPFEPSPQFQKAVDLFRKASEERVTLLKQTGKYMPERAGAVEWQPVMQNLGVKTIKEAKEITGFTKNPIYVQHIFEDAPKKFSDFFVNTAPVKNWKPGFLKKRTGATGYSVDPKEVLKWETAQTLKFKNNIDLLDKIKKLDFVEPLDNIKNLKPGYKVFAPDGYIRFYRGNIDLSKEFVKSIGSKNIKAIDDIWDTLKEAIDSSMIEKNYIGVTSKVKLYQVPNSVAGVLQGYARATNPYLKLFFDKPVDVFRFLALALTPRWLVNNIIGGTMFSIIAGDPLSPGGYLTAIKAQKLGLVPDDVFSGFYRTEKLMSGKLGRAAETKVGQIMSGVGEKVAELPIIKQIGKLGDLSYKINTVTDDFFRTAHYVNVATKTARKKIFQETGQKLNNTIKLLEYAKQDPEIIAKAVKSVEDFFYASSKLSPLERNVFRRILPFYSWYKFIATYSVKLPLEHPARFEVISNLAKTFYQMTGQDQLPNYLKGSVPIGEADDGSIYYLRTSGMNPFGFMEDLATIGLEQATTYSLTPLIKTLLERLTARESFSGKTYTTKDIVETYGGKIYKVNQDTGRVEEVEYKTKPALFEHLLRNFIPQYTMLEQAIVGGTQTYTAAGLPSLISGEGIKKSTITGEPITSTGAQEKVILRGLGLLGIPISVITPEQTQSSQESLQKATSQFFYQEYPMMSPQIKSKLKEEIKQKILNNVHKKGIIEGLW